jgi:hypothetical protein
MSTACQQISEGFRCPVEWYPRLYGRSFHVLNHVIVNDNNAVQGDDVLIITTVG